VTLDGTAYGSAIAGPKSIVLRGSLAFDAAPVVVPSPPAEGFLRVTTPFALTGSVEGFQTVDATDPLFSVNVSGSGTGTLVLDAGWTIRPLVTSSVPSNTTSSIPCPNRRHCCSVAVASPGCWRGGGDN
jgi:hypothetical protein